MSLERISRFLSYVLRHAPESIDLELDANGWARVDQLLKRSKSHGKVFSLEDLLASVAACPKQRYALSDDRMCIRANQGHSIASIDLGLEPVVPPEMLFHGTATRNLDSILSQGLLPQKRQHVHLSEQKETAITVGNRHGTPVILHIESGKMHLAGYLFYRSGNGVWLTNSVDPKFVSNMEYPTNQSGE